MALPILPALAFWPGFRHGELVFVLYREPKLLVAQLAGWATVLAVAWGRGGPARRLAAAVREPAVALLAAFTAYAALSGLWVEVRANYAYELAQWLLLTLLAAAFVAFAAEWPSRRPLLAAGLVAALVTPTVLGLLQLAVGRLPLLVPILSETPVAHPSLMGYKNPMALALLAQLFLLAWFTYRAWVAGERRAAALAVLLAAEAFYLITLQSRAAYFGLAAGLLALLGPLLWRVRSRRLALRRAGAFAALLLLVVGAAALLPGPRRRLASVGSYLADEAWRLEADRAAYLLNTLAMVRDRPFGVGLGDWQTQYPVYRAAHRYTSFTDEVQVRRAHGDYAQMLGELGWQGLLLWGAVLVTALGACWRRVLAGGSELDLFLQAQLVAVAVAGGGDFLLELPYGKLQVALLVALAAVPPAREAARETPATSPARLAAGRLALGAAALVVVAHAVAVATKSAAGADLRVVYAEVIGDGRPQAVQARARAHRAEAARLERRLVGLPGSDKTLHQSLLVLAHLADLAGERERASGLAWRALSFHPYSPNAFALLAALERERDPALAARYQETYDYVMHQATRGFRRPYPPPPGASEGAPGARRAP